MPTRDPLYRLCMALELMWVRALLVVDQEQSISRAAARLHMSQPALSRQIARLEALVGAELLVRSSTGVRTTAAGQELVAHGRRLLADADEALAATRRAAEQEQAPLRLAFQCDLAATLMPQLVTAFSATSPAVPVVTAQLPFPEQLRRLRARELDVAFVRPFCDLDGLRWRLLLPEPVGVALPTGHRLATADSVPLEELADETWIVMAPSVVGDDTARKLLQRLRSAGMTGQVLQTSTVQAGVGLVAAGFGVFACPMSSAATTPSTVALVPVEGWTTGVAMAWLPGPVSEAVSDFLLCAGRP
jgi:DNA-binding transcriptional LysR family regulator